VHYDQLVPYLTGGGPTETGGSREVRWEVQTLDFNSVEAGVFVGYNVKWVVHTHWEVHVVPTTEEPSSSAEL
jgi:hypothetical protein